MRPQSRTLAPGGAFVSVGVLQAARPARAAGIERGTSGEPAEDGQELAQPLVSGGIPRQWSQPSSAVALVSGSRALARVVAPCAHFRTSPQQHAPQHYPQVSHTHGGTRASSPHGRRPCCQPGCTVRGVGGSARAVGGIPCGLRGQPIPSGRGPLGTPAPPALSAPCPRARLPVCQP